MSQAESAREYLNKHHVLCLATAHEAQSWVSPVFYAICRDSLIFLSAPHTRHAKNIDENPLVSASVQEDYKDWTKIQGIQLQGNVELIGKPEIREAIRCYSDKFPVTGDQAPAEIESALNKVTWYRLRPELVYFIDNSKGLGFREKICPRQLFLI